MKWDVGLFSPRNKLDVK